MMTTTSSCSLVIDFALFVVTRSVAKQPRSGGGPKLLQGRQQLFRIGTARVVRVHFSVENDSVLADDKTRRHRQRPVRVSVDECEVALEDILVEVDEVIGQPEAKAEAAATALCGSDRIGKVSLFSRIDRRLFAAVCGEMATSWAPDFSSSGDAPWSAWGSMLQ
jgi:hypothetical protein